MMSSRNENSTYHCQTQLKQNILSFTWTIEDFLQIHKLNKELTFDKIKYLYFVMTHNGEYIYFNCYKDTDETKKLSELNISVSVFLKGFEEFYCVERSKDFKITNHGTTLYILPFKFLYSNKSIYLIKNRLTIHFELNIFMETFNRIIYHSYETLPADKDTSESNGAIIEQKSNSIVTFVINTERLKANKNILCSKSKVFEAMFNSGLEESTTNVIKITDIKYDILKELLYFVHSGCLSKTLTEMDTIHELLVAAEKYDIQDLKLHCEQDLIMSTTKHNVIRNLKLAYLNNGKILEEYTKSFIKLYLIDIIDTPEFITLMQLYPQLLTEIKNKEIHEF